MPSPLQLFCSELARSLRRKDSKYSRQIISVVHSEEKSKPRGRFQISRNSARKWRAFAAALLVCWRCCHGATRRKTVTSSQGLYSTMTKSLAAELELL